MTAETREYLSSLPLSRVVEYVRREYGVQPDFGFFSVEDPNRRLKVVATAQLHNFIERAEWGNPDPSILARKLTPAVDATNLLREALIRLVERMEESAR